MSRPEPLTIRQWFTAALIVVMFLAVCAAILFWAGRATGQTVTVDVSDIVDPIDNKNAEQDARLDAIEASLAPAPTPEPETPGEVDVQLPGTLTAGDSVTLVVTGADRVWVREAYEDGTDRVTDTGTETPAPDPYQLKLSPTAAGKIVARINPDSDAVITRKVDVLPGADTPPPVDPQLPGGEVTVGDGDDWAKAFRDLEDGQTLLLEPGSSFRGEVTLSDKRNVTIKPAGTSDWPVLHGRMLIGGTLQNVSLSFKIKVPVDEADGEPIGPGVTLFKGGKYSRIDGLTFDDFVVEGGTFGVVLNIMAEHREAGYYMRNIGFRKTDFVGQYRKSWLRSSGFQGDYIEGLWFEDVFGYMCGRNDLYGGKRTAENQFIYSNNRNTVSKADGIVSIGASFCSAQFRNWDAVDLRRLVTADAGGQTYLKAGSIQYALVHNTSPFRDGASLHGGIGLNVHDSSQPAPDAVTLSDIFINGHNGLVPSWGGGLTIDGHGGGDPPRLPGRAKVTGTVEVRGWGDLAVLVDGELDGAERVITDGSGPYRDSYEFDWEGFAQKQLNRKPGEWYSADIPLKFVGVMLE